MCMYACIHAGVSSASNQSTSYAYAWGGDEDGKWKSKRQRRRDEEARRGGGGVEGSRVAFVALRRWNGSRKGYVYKKGARGLGYYLDRQPLKKARK
jgi:hypothetical protein